MPREQVEWIRCICGARIMRSTVMGKLLPVENGCHEWQGQRDRNGYGRQCHALVSRLVWQFANGAIPAGQVVRHGCDNPPCGNLTDLLLGTQGDNIRDCIERGRRVNGAAHGERAHGALLTEVLVREIRTAHAGGASKIGLSRTYGVSRRCIQDLLAGRTWAHVE